MFLLVKCDQTIPERSAESGLACAMSQNTNMKVFFSSPGKCFRWSNGKA